MYVRLRVEREIITPIQTICEMRCGLALRRLAISERGCKLCNEGLNSKVKLSDIVEVVDMWEVQNSNYPVVMMHLV